MLDSSVLAAVIGRAWCWAASHVTLRARRNMRSLLVAVVNAETVNRAWRIPDIQWRSRTTPIDAQDAQGRLLMVRAVRYATRRRRADDVTQTVHGGRSVGEGQAVYNWSQRRRMTTKFTSGQADWTFSSFRDVAKTSLKSVCQFSTCPTQAQTFPSCRKHERQWPVASTSTLPQIVQVSDEHMTVDDSSQRGFLSNISRLWFLPYIYSIIFV